jgi:predicted AAA+ superfamily ATPase
MYKRIIEDKIKENLFRKKVIILYGPRQVGKTTLVKKIYDEYPGKKIYLQADIPSVRDGLAKAEPLLLNSFFNNSKLVIIDEAQLIENIGVVLKVYFDTYPDVQIIATGSSSFDLANKIREPLTGRATEYMLYPISVREIINTKGLSHYKSKEENFFRYGMYPGIMDLGEIDMRNSLGALENNTFYKDILTLENIKKPKILQDMIKFLAFNIGSIVTSSNMAREIGTTIKTIDRYIDILEKMFVIKKLYGYSNNKSNEIKKGYKVYFVDSGLRNSIIDNFNLLENREDIGWLFENFFIIEKIKSLEYLDDYAGTYFWQGERGLEVDYLEEKDGQVNAFECKYKNRKSKGATIFQNNYPKAKVYTVHKENYLNFL